MTLKDDVLIRELAYSYASKGYYTFDKFKD